MIITYSSNAPLQISMHVELTHALQKSRLLSFKEHGHIFASILDPRAQTGLDPAFESSLWSMVDYGTMCSEGTLVLPSRPDPAAPDDGIVPQDSPSGSIVMCAGGTAADDIYMPSSDQIHPDQIVFDNFDIHSLDYLLDLPSGSGQA